jgi:hypothetical protein
MRRQQPRDVFDGEMMKKGLIIRHLILPANTNLRLRCWIILRRISAILIFP